MYRFKRAETGDEFEQIFRLNHDVFAGELGQYAVRESSRLIDKFHGKNYYVIALAEGRVIGMISFHNQPPYSVADKLADPAVLEQLGRLAEVRLLAIDPAHRNGKVIRGLFLALWENSPGYEAVVISGHAAELEMYMALGFRPLGPPVRSGQAEFVPMVLRLADAEERMARWKRRGPR